MSKIRIVNWLLTRKCNLKCDYCAIVKDYKGMPPEYPKMVHYYHDQMTSLHVIEILNTIKRNNPEAFHIFYGGEPMLFNGLSHIINHCNDNNIYYTIISNNTPAVQPLIKKLFDETEYVQGFTSSVDPIFCEDGSYLEHTKLDRVLKSIEGFRRLKEIQKQGKVKDVVAEITVMKNNIMHLYDLVKILTDEGISSDITFIDIAKNDYYDFSNIKDPNLLVTKDEAAGVMEKLLKSDLNIHMKETLLPAIFNILPSEMDCELEKGVHNISIDSDGTLRLCLRIKGVITPTIRADDFIDDRGNVTEYTRVAISEDKKRYCKLCNHTCLLMSKIIDNSESSSADLVHLDRRQGA
jgi:MoaA/NifB/PqqE/SkfB family radical SAM enzyme